MEAAKVHQSGKPAKSSGVEPEDGQNQQAGEASPYTVFLFQDQQPVETKACDINKADLHGG